MGEAAKKAVNLRISKELIDQAKAMQVNLSQVLETSLVEVLRERQQKAWLADNKEAIEAYNQRVESQGVFSDGLRNF